MKRFIYAVVLAASVFSMAGCNTVKGAGKDVQKAGQGLENAADNTGGTQP